MIRYIVKVIAKSTEENRKGAGHKTTACYGKDDTLLWFKDELFNCESAKDAGLNYSIATKGYCRKGDAKHNYQYRRIINGLANTKSWTYDVEIVKIEFKLT